MRYSLKLVHNIGEENLPHITFTGYARVSWKYFVFPFDTVKFIKGEFSYEYFGNYFSGVLTLIIFIIIFLFLKVDKLEKEYHIFTDEHTLKK